MMSCRVAEVSILKFAGLFKGVDGGEFSLLHRRVPSRPLLHIQVDLLGIVYSDKNTLTICYRTNKSEGTTLFLADVLSACYGLDIIIHFAIIIITLFIIFILVLIVVAG